MHCLCAGRHAQRNTVRLEGGSGTTGCSQSTQLVGKAVSKMEQQGRDLWFKDPPRAGRTCFAHSQSLDRRAQENPGPVEQRSKRHSKQRKQAWCHDQRSPGSEVTAFAGDIPGRECPYWEGAGGIKPRPPMWSPDSSSQALTAGCSAAPIISVQGTEPKVTAVWNTPLCPQHPGVGSNLVQ